MSEQRRRGPMGGHGRGMRPTEKAKDFKGAMSKLFRYMSRYKMRFVLVFIFAIAGTVFNIVGPKILGKATTELYTGLVAKVNGTGGIDFAKIGTILLWTLGLYVASACFSFIQGWIMTGISNDVTYNLRKDISKKINHLPLNYFESRTNGEILSRVTNDIDTLQMSLNQSLTQLITSVTTLIGVFIMMLSINVWMTLVALLILPVSMFIIQMVMKHSQKYFQAQQNYLGAVNGQIEENFGGHDVVRVFNKENDVLDEFEKDNKKRYKLEDYQKLLRFYENKIQQIHIVGEYAQKMIAGSEDALKFVDDYFALNYASFLNLYFKGSRQSEIKRNITPAKYRQLFGELSPAQLQIIRDQESKYIVVAAGPGSGKTRVLVHKLASLMLMEDVKHEQLLMLTFSRAAATEFKKRLLKLIGNAANFIEIKTFHSYCFDLLGQIGSLERVDNVLKCAVERIEKGDVELSRITKNVLVIDEAQDMNEDEFSLIEALIRHNDDMRIIAVGDDDQSIYEFRHASPQYFKRLIREYGAMKYELVENFRSKSNLVDFTNQFVARIHHRLKENPIIAKQADNGKIKVVRYKSENLIEPLVKDILSAELRGSVCVLTYTNDEALQVSGLLLKNGMPAQLIQDNSGFCLLKLDEINFFLSRLHSVEDIFLIDDDVWDQAKKELQTVFQNSSKLESCLGLIRDFETINPKRRYKSDLELFIRESKLNDFFGESGETIFVSTIHKVKGKEFDHVFLMLNNFNLSSDERIRQLYVAMTRARRELTIHLNSDFLDGLSSKAVEHIEDKNDYLPPEELAIHLTHSDIWLDYFINRQPQIAQLRSGDTLYVRGDECLDGNGQSVLKFSRNFMSEHYERLHRQGYELKRAMVNFIVYWQSEKVAKEIKIILPELFFERKKIS